MSKLFTDKEPETGLFFKPTPKGLAKAIINVRDNYHKFSSREYVLNNTGSKNSLAKLKEALHKLCDQDGNKYHFEDIYWDGRNQSLLWEKTAISEIRRVIKEISLN